MPFPEISREIRFTVVFSPEVPPQTRDASTRRDGFKVFRRMAHDGGLASGEASRKIFFFRESHPFRGSGLTKAASRTETPPR